VVYKEHIYGGTNSKHAADGDKTHNFNIAGDDDFDLARKDDSDTTIILTSLHNRPERELYPSSIEYLGPHPHPNRKGKSTQRIRPKTTQARERYCPTLFQRNFDDFFLHHHVFLRHHLLNLES
jgi:hypothetical protein